MGLAQACASEGKAYRRGGCGAWNINLVFLLRRIERNVIRLLDNMIVYYHIIKEPGGDVCKMNFLFCRCCSIIQSCVF